MITIEQLSPHLANHLKAVRLTALKDTPSAFGSTYAKESLLSQDDWLKRATKWSSDRSVCYIAMDQEAPCGIIAGKFEEEDLERAWVVSMWVAPTHRSTGLGTRLMNAVQAWAQSIGVHELRLMVTSNNAKARRFYEKCGYSPTGMTQPYENDAALFEYEMFKVLPH